MYVWTNFVHIVTIISFKISSIVYIYKQIQFYILIIIAIIAIGDTIKRKYILVHIISRYSLTRKSIHRYSLIFYFTVKTGSQFKVTKEL